MTNIEVLLQTIVEVLQELATRERSSASARPVGELTILHHSMTKAWLLYKDELNQQRETLQAKREQFMGENESAFSEWLLKNP